MFYFITKTGNFIIKRCDWTEITIRFSDLAGYGLNLGRKSVHSAKYRPISIHGRLADFCDFFGRVLAGRLAGCWLAQDRVRIQCVYVFQLNLRIFDQQIGRFSSRSESVHAAVDLA
jgi:hypothetical protein